MTFRHFEREFLRLAFTTSIDLSPSSVAFLLDCSVREAERHMNQLASLGVLELESDDGGHLRFAMPDRPKAPLGFDELAPVVSLTASSTAMTLRPAAVIRERPTIGSGQAMIAMFLNAMVCPGVGSLVGGRTAIGIAQLSLFLVGLPLAVFTIGVPLMLAAWVWGVTTGAQLLSEARD